MSEEKIQEARAKTLEGVPGKYRAVYVKAYSGNSKAAALKAFCLFCTGNMVKEVRNCSSWACPLHPYRPYQAEGEEDGSED